MAWLVAGAALAQTAVAGVCPHRFALSVGEQLVRVAYCARQPLDVPDGAAQHAVVVIHGDHRNAGSNHRSVEQAAAAAGVPGALIVTPQFITERDADAHGLASDLPRWSADGWKQGDRSRPTAALPPSASVSSFTVVDQLVQRLADRALFRNVEQLVVAGHSVGGQFVHRYAAASPVEETLRPLGIRVRYVVGSPSSYLYFDPRRPVPEQAGELAIPSEAVLAECPRYNHYRYGLENLNQYARAVGSERLRAQYASRTVVLLLGGRDNDPHAVDLDTGCAAQLQGAERLERGNQFYASLGEQFGPDIYARQAKAIIPDADHSPSLIFNSPAGRAALFERDPPPPTLSR
jgi:pimeloyl-ACP methyl ester carboxylesterase